MQYLEFEQPIEQLNNKLIKAKELASKKNMNTSKKIIDIENQIQEAKKKYIIISQHGKKFNYQDIQIDHTV